MKSSSNILQRVFSEYFAVVIIFIVAGMLAAKLIGANLDRPQAFSPDGRTIVYFEMPNKEGKTVKVLPGEKQFDVLEKKGNYDMVWIAPSQAVK